MLTACFVLYQFFSCSSIRKFNLKLGVKPLNYILVEPLYIFGASQSTGGFFPCPAEPWRSGACPAEPCRNGACSPACTPRTDVDEAGPDRKWSFLSVLGWGIFF